jgi:putative tricarboxylic transport membrane protein
MLPAVLAVCCLGTYSVDGSMAGPLTLFIFAIIGYLMVRFDYPVAAAVVGLVLGRLLETEFLRSMQVSGGDLSYVFERPAAIAIFALMVLSLAATAWSKRRVRPVVTEGRA